MNREIKFRALKDDISNCNFVYGQLVYDAIGIPRITVVDKSGEGLLFHSCIKGTEGQYTGLKDRNGKEIYEGDIVMCKTADPPEHKGFICEFKDYRWKFQNVFLKNDDFYGTVNYAYISTHTEVIGNIHENPELLKPE